MRKEAVLSSKIEGTQASLSDLLIFEASNQSQANTSDVNEVMNYVRALEHGLRSLRDFPLSLRLLRDLHRLMLVDPTKTPGEFRRSQNWIGAPGCTLDEASYIPPPPAALMDHLGRLEAYLHSPPTLPALIRYAIVHYQFEAIHPFLDGNGRIGRLLITLLMCADPVESRPLLPEPLLYLSAFFEARRSEYYERLSQVSRKGDWEGWFAFFLEAVRVQALDAISRSERLMSLREEFRKRLQDAKASAQCFELTDMLFSSPATTVSDAARTTTRTYAGAKMAVVKLVELGILAEFPSQRTPKVFISKDILEVLG